jgi:uncharacterized membrane protein YhaH (DUF805 family)
VLFSHGDKVSTYDVYVVIAIKNLNGVSLNTTVHNPYNAPGANLSKAGMGAETYEPKVFAINGRIGRLRYLAYTVGLSFGLMILAGILGAIFAAIKSELMMVAMIIYLPAAALSFIMAIRRLNDMDHPGWWSLLSLIPLINLFFFLWLLFAPGDAQANHYGAPPSFNSGGVVAAACILPAIFVIGILAAVTIPAYQSFVLMA